MRLQLTIQQTQQYDLTGTSVYYQGNNVNSLNATTGTLPAARQWRNFGSAIDVTDKVSDLYSLKLTWTTQADNEGFIAPGTFNAKKAASGKLTFEAEAYQLLKKWLVEDVSAQLNSVDVNISHYDNNNVLCGTYTNWVIKATDIEWCEDGLCTFDTVMKQKDELYNCMRSTLVTDDWQGWFNDKTTHPHPRFSVCNEIRPNGMLILQWQAMTIISFILNIVLYIVASILNPLFLVLNVVFAIIRAIKSILGMNNPDKPEDLNYIDPSEYKKKMGNFYIAAAGCEREIPSPLYRDYITNVCSKCGITVDAVSAPIFFAQNITVETSSRGIITDFNPHYNICDYYTPSRKGVRRFRNLSLFGYSEPDTTYFLFDNRRIQTLDMFLDEIKGLYNCEWNLKGGTLYFQRKDFFRLPTSNYVLDLSENGADRNRLLEGICFTWNERKIPAYVQGLYTQDGVDTCGDEAKAFMNDIMTYGDGSKNPVFNGVQDKTVQFGATKFRGDGVDTDYIMDAFQSVVNSNFLTGVFGGNTLFNSVKPLLQLYADHALLTRDDKSNLPKAIIWDGASYYNARSIINYAGIDTFGAEPVVNHAYNSKVYGQITGWSTAHKPSTFVRGSSLTFGSHPVGKYVAKDLLGTHYYEMIAYLINYPMYFGIGYQDSMWDWFHWIDDPNRRNVLNRTANAKIKLCCETLNKLRVFGNGNNIALGERMLLPNNTEGIISKIEPSYDTNEDRGQYIEIEADS